MPFTGYFGLPRSGKSYEVVSGPICDAVAVGRRVVTNVEGISSDKVRNYVNAKRGIPFEKLGSIVFVPSSDIACLDEEGVVQHNPFFFPHYGREKEIVTNTFVEPGDLVVLDEAWKLFPAGEKVHPNHLSFFAEHGHFIHPVTGVACDLVFMTQSLDLVHRNLKAMCSFLFQTHRKNMFGSIGSNKYSITMWEGNKAVKTAKCGEWFRKYKPEIFELYKSFHGEAAGKLLDVDKRQNVLKSWKSILFLVSFPILGYISYSSFTKFYDSFHTGPVTTPASSSNLTSGLPQSSNSSQSGVPVSNNVQSSSTPLLFILGELTLHGVHYVVVKDSASQIRFLNPQQFVGHGVLMVGNVDGAKAVPVNFSASNSTQSFPGQTK